MYDEIGISIPLLFGFEDFLLMYLHQNIPVEDQLYFTRYFDEYIFGGKNLFAFFDSEENSFMGLVKLATAAASGDKQYQTVAESLIEKVTGLVEQETADDSKETA